MSRFYTNPSLFFPIRKAHKGMIKSPVDSTHIIIIFSKRKSRATQKYLYQRSRTEQDQWQLQWFILHYNLTCPVERSFFFYKPKNHHHHPEKIIVELVMFRMTAKNHISYNTSHSNPIQKGNNNSITNMTGSYFCKESF